MTESTNHTSGLPVVVGVDGSEESKLALAWAVRLARPLGARVEAITCWEYPTAYGWALGLPTGWRPDTDAEKVLNSTVDEVFGEERPHDLCLTVTEGRAATVLIAASKRARMVVVGSRGHGGFPGMLLGSVSSACAAHAACPVLVVHGDRPDDRD